MPTTQTFRHPLTRQSWFHDFDGVWSTVKTYDSKLTYTFDITDLLASGETISSVVWVANGPTLSSESTSSPQHTVTVLGSGEAEATITTSSSRIIVTNYRWIASDAAPLKDY